VLKFIIDTFSGWLKGGFLVLQTGALATLMESYRAYQIFFEGFCIKGIVSSLCFIKTGL